MIAINFGRWSLAAGRWLVRERVYRSRGRWTPFVRVSKRHRTSDDRLHRARLWPSLVLCGLASLLVGCTPVDDLAVGPEPSARDPHPTPTAPEPPAPFFVGDRVLEFNDPTGDHSLSVPVHLSLQPGERKSVQLTLVAGASAAFDIIVAQSDSTSSVFEGTPIFYRRSGLQLSDETGRILADAVIVVPYIFTFDSPGEFGWGLPFLGKVPGRSMVHVIWTFADGQKIGLATIEVEVE